MGKPENLVDKFGIGDQKSKSSEWNGKTQKKSVGKPNSERSRSAKFTSGPELVQLLAFTHS